MWLTLANLSGLSCQIPYPGLGLDSSSGRIDELKAGLNEAKTKVDFCYFLKKIKKITPVWLRCVFLCVFCSFSVFSWLFLWFPVFFCLAPPACLCSGSAPSHLVLLSLLQVYLSSCSQRISSSLYCLQSSAPCQCIKLSLPSVHLCFPVSPAVPACL